MRKIRPKIGDCAPSLTLMHDSAQAPTLEVFHQLPQRLYGLDRERKLAGKLLNGRLPARGPNQARCGYPASYAQFIELRLVLADVIGKLLVASVPFDLSQHAWTSKATITHQTAICAKVDFAEDP